MTTIAERQQDPTIWRYQVGARNSYARAKRYRLLQLIPEVSLVVAGAVLAITGTEAEWIGAAAGAWIFVSRLVVKPLEQRNRHRGAVLQEHFDTTVFELPWNDALCSPVAGEDAVRAAGHDAAQPDPWYPSTATDGIAAVLACQRANIVWARRQHEAYAWVVGWATAALGLAGIVLALVLDAGLGTYLTTLLLPTLPALLDGAEIAAAHRQSALARRGLEPVVDAAMSSRRQRDAREIQNRIFGLRNESPLVSETFYHLARSRFEEDMTAAYEER